jgi:trimeric autotransporter adhesin
MRDNSCEVSRMKFYQKILVMFFFTSIFLSACGASGVSTNSTNASLQSIEITPTNPTIAKGTTQRYNATGIYSSLTTNEITTLINWSSSNTAVATINSLGVANAISVGTTTITATDGITATSTTLTVTSAMLQSISVTPTNPTIANGTAQQFTATGIYSDNTTQDITTTVIWDSSAAAVASISMAQGFIGKATSVSAGTTVVNATDLATNISGSTTLTVTAATLVSMSVTPANRSSALGTSQQFIATGIYSDNSTQNITAYVTWSSSSLSAATISNASGSNGVATPVAVGSTMITATLGGISDSTILTVTSATLDTLAITPSSPSIALGTTQQFTATGTYSDGSTQTLTTAVTWASLASSVAAISNAAGSNGLSTPVATGSATITATLGSKSGSTLLTVTPATLITIAITPLVSSLTTGSTQQFMATGMFSDGSTQDLTLLATWSSSSSGVAAISNAAGSKGLATSITAGSTVISSVWSGASGTGSLTVTAPIVVTLTWDAPTSYSDGTPLNPATDISMYKIYYGTASGVYAQVVCVPNPATTTITKTLPLAHGTYYFVVSDVDAAGQESNYSNEFTTTI